MLKLDKICVSFRRECQDKLFGHTKQQVLFDVSAEVKKGTCLGILGESGSGKSIWQGVMRTFKTGFGNRIPQWSFRIRFKTGT